MAARLLGIATRTIYRHLERQESGEEGGNDGILDEDDASSSEVNDEMKIQ